MDGLDFPVTLLCCSYLEMLWPAKTCHLPLCTSLRLNDNEFELNDFPPVSNCCFSLWLNLLTSVVRLSLYPPFLPLISCPSCVWMYFLEKVNSYSSACRVPWFQLWTEDWNGNGNERKSRLRSSNACTASWLAHQLSRERERVRKEHGWVGG